VNPIGLEDWQAEGVPALTVGRRAAERIPGARLVEFPELGHAPQIQDPEAFHATLLKGLANP
jgi:pimeloyl-ACP methyl ester carboxylesterase